jgi:hypothetical protein
VLYILYSIGDLYDAVSYTVSVFGKVGHGQRDRIDVLVDGGSEHGARMVIEIRWVVASAAEKTDPERGSRNIDH